MKLGWSDSIGEGKSEIRAMKAHGQGNEFGKVGSLWGILKAGKWNDPIYNYYYFFSVTSSLYNEKPKCTEFLWLAQGHSAIEWHWWPQLWIEWFHIPCCAVSFPPALTLFLPVYNSKWIFLTLDVWANTVPLENGLGAVCFIAFCSSKSGGTLILSWKVLQQLLQWVLLCLVLPLSFGHWPG